MNNKKKGRYPTKEMKWFWKKGWRGGIVFILCMLILFLCSGEGNPYNNLPNGLIIGNLAIGGLCYSLGGWRMVHGVLHVFIPFQASLIIGELISDDSKISMIIALIAYFIIFYSITLIDSVINLFYANKKSKRGR